MAPSQTNVTDPKRSYDKWSSKESLYLLTLLYEAVLNNVRYTSGGCIPKDYVISNILPELNRKMKTKFDYQKNYASKWKYFKRLYAKFEGLKRFSSGFGWDSETKRFTAPKEIWEEYFKSHPDHRNLKTDTVDGWDMLEVVVGTVIYNGESQVGISVVASDVVGQTGGVEDDDLEEKIDMNVHDTPTQQRDAMLIQERDVSSENNKASEPSTDSRRKRPRGDGSQSRGDSHTREFTEPTEKISYISAAFEGTCNLVNQNRMAKERESALRNCDPWEALREIPEIDMSTRFRALRMLMEKKEDKSFLKMTLNERRGWIRHYFSAYIPSFD